MEIADIRLEKEKCESLIRQALSEFCDKTGLSVYDVNALTHSDFSTKKMFIDTVEIALGL